MKNFLAVRLLAFALPTMCAFSASAQYQASGNIYYEYKEKIDDSTNIGALGDGLFGDSTNYENGATTFSNVDVKASTNVKVPMQLGRILNVRAAGVGAVSDVIQNPEVLEIFGTNWSADVPYIENDGLVQDGWLASGMRCSGGNFSISAANVSELVVPAYNFFFGNNINIPGYGKERLLALLPGGITPTDGVKYVGTTQSNWAVSCLQAIKNGSGEGFVVTLQDGAKYYFDWLATADTGYITTGRGNLNLRRFRLYATKAVDRFGGALTYTYDPSYPHRITHIQSSDGAEIGITYDPSNGKVATVTAGVKVWQYTYVNTSLSTVTLPDMSKWTYTGPPNPVSGNTGADPCYFTVGTRSSSQSPGPYEAQTFQITHPSGAVGVFSFRAIMFGYNRTPGRCEKATDYRPKAYIGNALYAKSISGPGIVAKTLNITYAPSWSYVSECTNCPTTATTVVTDSSGRTVTYVFGNDYSSNASQLLSKTITGSEVSWTENYEYLASATGQLFPDAIGEDKYQLLSNSFLLKRRPLKAKTIITGGQRFTSSTEAYDRFARPTSVTKSSAPLP